MKQLDRWLIYFSVYLALLPVVPLLYYWWKEKVLKTDVLIVFFLVNAAVEVVTSTLAWYKIRNIDYQFLYTPLEFLFLSWSSNMLMKKPRWWATIGGTAALLVFYLFNFREVTPLTLSHIRTISCLLLVIMGLLALYDVMVFPQKTFIQESALFWLGTAMLLYGAGTLCLFMLRSFAVSRSQLPREIWTLHSVVNIVYNFMLLKTFLCHRKG